MRIGIDAHALGTRSGGNETYIRNLLHALRENPQGVEIIIYVNGNMAEHAWVGFPAHALRTRSSYLRVPLALPVAVRRTHVDLLHVQYNAPPVCPCPFVVSLHDIVWKNFPETVPFFVRQRQNLLVPNALRRAARVFVLTEALKHEIADTYKVPEDRFDVVQPCVDPLFQRNEDAAALDVLRRKYKLSKDYVLCVGALQPRKNLARLAEAFAGLERRGLPHKLVVVGEELWLCGDTLKRIQALKLGERIGFTGYVRHEDLPSIVSGASAFAYVSLYEGFGIPLLEAMACGTPVLASTDAAIVEVAGGGALLVDPFSVDAIEDGLARILTDSDLRARLRAAGPVRAKYFSGRRTAEAAVAGYKKALA